MKQDENTLEVRDQADRARQERFMGLLNPVLPRLSRYCHALTRDPEEGRDLLSDAILLGYERFEALRNEKAFTSYVFTTARHLYYRRERRRKWWGVLANDAHEKIPDDRPPAGEIQHDIQVLNEALGNLPEKQREAVILFEISGLSLEEVREIQGGSLSGVKTRLVRGREKLAELLGERSTTNSAVSNLTPQRAAQSSSSLERARIAYSLREKV